MNCGTLMRRAVRVVCAPEQHDREHAKEHGRDGGMGKPRHRARSAQCDETEDRRPWHEHARGHLEAVSPSVTSDAHPRDPSGRSSKGPCPADAATVAIRHVRSACSSGWPMPRSVANDSAARSSASLSPSAMPSPCSAQSLRIAHSRCWQPRIRSGFEVRLSAQAATVLPCGLRVISFTKVSTAGSAGVIRWPPGTSTLRQSGMADAMASVTSRKTGGESADATTRVG